MQELPTVSPTTVAELVGVEHVMDAGVRPLWGPMPTVVGPAHIVRCAPGDNLMLHAAIYRAAPGSVIVADAGGSPQAVAGGNVCAIAQARGIAGFVVEGNVRDLAEAREMGFPLVARGVFPTPGTKKGSVEADEVVVGGVTVRQGDVVVADEEGVVVLPAAQAATLLDEAVRREAAEGDVSLAAWEANHRAKVLAGLEAAGDTAGLPD